MGFFFDKIGLNISKQINMGIKVEFNPDLALRNISEFKNGNRKIEECITEDIEAGKIYPFLKKEQRLYLAVWRDSFA